MARRVAGRTRRAYLCLKSVRIFSKTFTKKLPYCTNPPQNNLKKQFSISFLNRKPTGAELDAGQVDISDLPLDNSF
jgi:hypothetical protein